MLLAVSCGKRGEQARQKAESDALPLMTTKTGIEMVLIPAGWFEMGSDSKDEIDEPRHRTYVGAFYMDVYEVTQAEYQKVMGKNPSRWKHAKNPVEQIRWSDAVRYCNARSRSEGLEPAYDLKTWECDFETNGYRLPTEAEWERGARAGTGTTYYFGNNSARLRLHCWFKGNATRGPSPVGIKQPNPWGLYDVYGNVWEWCNDFYAEDYYQKSPEKNSTGPKAGTTRVLRGGCWDSAPDKCRSSYRENEDPGYTDVCFGADTHGFCGLRCVRNGAASARGD